MTKKRTLSPEHLAKLQAGRLKKQQEQAQAPVEIKENSVPEIAKEQDTNDLQRQVQEMKETMDLMRAALLNQNQVQQNNAGFSSNGRRIGEFEKYTTDPDAYPDPTTRLADEPRLAPLAFKYNYELDYEVGISSYETKTGENIKEPKFNVTLLKKVMNDQGEPVRVTDPTSGKLHDKFYIARKLIFHEDPQTAMVIARENGLEVGEQDEKLFLNEMRYLRVRDWLFDIFWPKPAQAVQNMGEEVIGGQRVQVFTRNSEETGSIPFDSMSSKLRA